MYSCLNSGFKQKLLMVPKILLIEIGRSFANYLQGARILLNNIIHVSGVSRSNINCETEAELVFIGTIIAWEKFWRFCCCWACLYSSWSWLNGDCLWALILSVSRWSEDDRVEELCQLHSRHPVPWALRQGLHGSEGGLPGLGSKTCYSAIQPIFFFFFPAWNSSACRRCSASAALGPASSLLLCPLPIPCQPQSWFSRDLPFLAHFHMDSSAGKFEGQ